MKRLVPLVFLAVAAAACGRDPLPITIHLPADVHPGLRIATDDLVADLGRLTDAPITEGSLPAPECRRGEIHLLVVGHAHDEGGAAAESTLDPQAFVIEDEACARGGRRIVLHGGSPMAAQWAVYDLLMAVGIRYWHPEATYYPQALEWPESVATEAAPSFRRRSMNAHRTHPIELSAPHDPGEVDMAAHQRRWIDWNVKIRQTAVGGWDEEFVGTYAFDRGFPRLAGFNLLNTQQGMEPVLDPDSEVPEEDQMAAAIDARLAPVDGLPPAVEFHFQFNPSEFTEAGDLDTVRRLTFIADYIETEHPGVAIYATNHGTGQEPTEHYGVRFFDLPQFAPPALGVKVHTLMFYDLERPAPVYGNTDFQYLRDFALAEQAHRRILHYPESSWWLTFDLPVPLYLAPVTLEARQWDIDLLAPYLSTADDDPAGVYGHHLFTSGQEWGYWLIDYCTAMMAWDVAFTHADCIDDFAGRLEGGEEITAVLREVEARQIDDMRDPEIIRYLVGSDDETEVAAEVGIDFHPLPPGPAAVLGWDDAKVADVVARSLEPLSAIAEDYHRFADRVEATLPDQSEAQAPWVREIRDGLRIFALRAEHSRTIYETAIALRAALADSDLSAVNAAAAGVEAARAITEQAREIVRAREADYRYPDALTIAGDEPGSPGAIPNRTIYPYRYLSRTHRMFYWTRPDDQLAALFGEGLELVRVDRRILTEGTALEVSLVADTVDDLLVDWGDGTVVDHLEPHLYTDPGFFVWTLDATTSEGVLHHEDDAVIVDRRIVFPKGSLQIEEPAGAGLVAALLPGFIVGLGDDGDPFLALGRVDGSTPVAAHRGVQRRDRTGAVSGPADLALSLQGVGDLVVLDALLEVEDGSGPTDRRLSIEGEMRTQDIVDLLVSVGGFDEPGARKLVADVLDYTPETLPERVEFWITATGTED